MPENESPATNETDFGRLTLEVLLEVRQKLDADRFREGLISRLQDELEVQRQSQAEKLLLPLINGVIRLHADITRMLEALRREAPERLTPERFLKWVGDFRSDLELLLDHGGVTLYTEPDFTFNPHRQVAQRTVPTSDTALGGKVAERLRPGFERNGRVVEKERVSVYLLTPTPVP